MKAALIVAVFTYAAALPVYAADISTNSQVSGKSIEQRRSEILKHIDQRIALSQQEKSCIQAAQSDTEFRACRDKYRPVKKNDDRNRTNNQP